MSTRVPILETMVWNILRGFGNHWITVLLEGNESNRSAIGARIRVVVGGNGEESSIYRHVCSGGSFGANPLRQYFGLGKAKVSDPTFQSRRKVGGGTRGSRRSRIFHTLQEFLHGVAMKPTSLGGIAGVRSGGLTGSRSRTTVSVQRAPVGVCFGFAAGLVATASAVAVVWIGSRIRLGKSDG